MIEHHAWVRSTPSSASDLRRTMDDNLTEAGLTTSAIADATHVLYELVMNGVEHGVPDADGGIDVSWVSESSLLRISVHDSGRAGDGKVIAALRPTPDLPGGRGLTMVDAFGQRWDAERNAGTRVTAWVQMRMPAGT